ncbi:MAG: sugar phosphate isomerase/epimerase [Clostridia bacterium]|nr:sugar phosphate isomerase/epimerase [Clostridia bacterium]
MKLSVFANLYGDKTLAETLDVMKKLGIDTVEIGAGGYPGKNQCDPDVLLSDKTEFYKFRETFNTYDIDICALSVHGNPVHPDKDIAKSFDHDFRQTVLLAEMLEIDTVVGFSGCPGDSENSKYPNWVTCPWPDDFLTILDWQWNDVLLPYWREASDFALSHGVTKIAFEMHPGFCVYNPETALRIRKEIGKVIGVNFDPSHLIWQGIEPAAAIRELGDSIYHFHAKDTKIDKYNTAKFGVLDTKHYGDELHRSWIFRSCGYGNSESYWRDMVSALRLVGYDKVMSIEHEDSLMSLDEGLKKAIDFLRGVIINEPKPGTMSWA